MSYARKRKDREKKRGVRDKGYEKGKARLASLNLTPKGYQERAKALARKHGL